MSDGNFINQSGFLASQGSGGANVVGTASSTDNAVVRWDGATGRLLQDSSVTISDTGGISGVTLSLSGLADYADDAAAAAGGVPVNGLYRTASALKIRVA